MFSFDCDHYDDYGFGGDYGLDDYGRGYDPFEEENRIRPRIVTALTKQRCAQLGKENPEQYLERKLAQEMQKAQSRVEKEQKKLDEEIPKVPTVPLAFRLAVAQARNEKGWKQKDLAQKAGITLKTLQDFESGKATLPKAIESKIKRLLHL